MPSKHLVKDLGEIGMVSKTDPKAFADAEYVFFDGFTDVKSL